MKFSIADAVRSRRSVRTFDDKRLKDSDLEALKEFTKKDLNPFGLSMQENGHEGKFVKEAPDIKVPEGLTYTISYERAK